MLPGITFPQVNTNGHLLACYGRLVSKVWVLTRALGMGEQSLDGLDGCFSLTIASRIPRCVGVMVKLPVCCTLSEECIGKLGAIGGTEYLWDAMFCNEFLED